MNIIGTSYEDEKNRVPIGFAILSVLILGAGIWIMLGFTIQMLIP